MTIKNANQMVLCNIIKQTIREELMNELSFIKAEARDAIAERICKKIQGAIVNSTDDETTKRQTFIGAEEMGW